MSITTVVLEAPAAPLAVTDANVGEWTATVSAPLARMVVSTRAVAADKAQYATAVLNIFVETVKASIGGANAGLAARVLDSLMGRTADVGAILESNGTPEEVRADTIIACDNKLHQLSGPLWRLAVLIEANHKGVSTEIRKEKQTLAGFNKWTADQIDALAFDDSRKTVTVSYTPKRGDKEVSFTVGAAIKTLDDHMEAVTAAAKIEEVNGKKWAAVRRQYRKDNPAGMPDGRTARELKAVDARIAVDLFNALTEEERNEKRATL
tara:strand:+ start:190 stop:984 length:795 start_codon:yes stop_codon:yes gene_type:complete